MRFPLPDAMERVLRALQPVSEQVVLVGGWAHRFHAEHPLATPTFEPLTTTDCDIALPLQLTGEDELDLEVLLLREGLHLNLSGNEAGESRRYVLDTEPGFYVQFLTRRRGSITRRDGGADSQIPIAGVLAEALRDVDLALGNRWKTTVAMGDGRSLRVCVIQPVAFLIGKLLVSNYPRRGARNRAKDLLYVADTLFLFQEALDALGIIAKADILPHLSKRQSRSLHSSLRNHLEGPGSDTFHAAAELSIALGHGRPQTASGFRALLRFGLESLGILHWAP